MLSTECKNAIPSVPNHTSPITRCTIASCPQMLLDQDLTTNNDVVDRDVNELDEETDETHDGKPNRCGHGNLLEFFSVRFCAPLYKPYGVFDELPAGLNKLHYLIHGALLFLTRSLARRQSAE